MNAPGASQEPTQPNLPPILQDLVPAFALGAVDPDRVWRGAGEGLPADFQTSMLQSLVAGSVTEVDTVNGAVCRLGRALGVPTPVNDTLVAAVKGCERAVANRESSAAGAAPSSGLSS